MPNWVRALRSGSIVCLLLWPFAGTADDFATQISHAELVKQDENYNVQTKIRYQLSPTAKEALHKGIPLTWQVLLEIREIGKLWDSVIYSRKLPYRLRFHALLNQYEIATPDKQSEMFLTMNVALGYMSSLPAAPSIAAKLLRPGHHYKLAMKCLFDRESLPVPLRPFAYLDSQWQLSSDWYIWPIQK